MVGPTPGTEASRSSFSRQAGEPHRFVDVGLEAGELLLQRGEQTGDAFLQALFDQALLALALGDDHLDDLASPSDKIGQKPGLFVGHRPDVRFGRLDEMGDHRRVDRVGLGSFAERLRGNAKKKHLTQQPHVKNQVPEWVTRWGDSRIGCGLIQDGKHMEVCHDGGDFVAG